MRKKLAKICKLERQGEVEIADMVIVIAMQMEVVAITIVIDKVATIANDLIITCKMKNQSNRINRRNKPLTKGKKKVVWVDNTVMENVKEDLTMSRPRKKIKTPNPKKLNSNR